MTYSFIMLDGHGRRARNSTTLRARAAFRYVAAMLLQRRFLYLLRHLPRFQRQQRARRFPLAGRCRDNTIFQADGTKSLDGDICIASP